jgi:hypothetical protein
MDLTRLCWPAAKCGQSPKPSIRAVPPDQPLATWSMAPRPTPTTAPHGTDKIRTRSHSGMPNRAAFARIVMPGSVGLVEYGSAPAGPWAAFLMENVPGLAQMGVKEQVLADLSLDGCLH